MLSVIMTAFLSFSIISGTCTSNDPYGTSEASELHDVSIYGPNGESSSSEKPSPNVELGEFEVSWWRNGFIGRHQMVSLDSYAYVDYLPIEILTYYYEGSITDDFEFSQTVTSITSNTISTSVEVSSTFAEKIGAKISVDGIGIELGASSSKEITLNQTVTYSFSKEVSYTVTAKISKDVVGGKKFAMCLCCYVYKVSCTMWQYDNYAWGNYEVSGSRSSFDTYLLLTPTVSVIFSNGEYIK